MSPPAARCPHPRATSVPASPAGRCPEPRGPLAASSPPAAASSPTPSTPTASVPAATPPLTLRFSVARPPLLTELLLRGRTTPVSGPCNSRTLPLLPLVISRRRSSTRTPRQPLSPTPLAIPPQPERNQPRF